MQTEDNNLFSIAKNNSAVDISQWTKDTKRTIMFQKQTLQAILNWKNFSGEGDSFNSEFVESLLSHLDKNKQLSTKQVASLNKIINNFQINIGEWI